MTTTTKRPVNFLGVRTDARDGWRYLPDDEDSIMCPKCRPTLSEPPKDDEAIPLGGNMVPEILSCCACNAVAHNPGEYSEKLAFDLRFECRNISRTNEEEHCKRPDCLFCRAANDVDALDLIASHVRRWTAGEVDWSYAMGLMIDTIEASGRKVR